MDGAPDREAYFASEEGAKPPSILAAGAGHKEKRSRFFALSKRQSHDVVIAFLYGNNKKKFYQTKGEFASSYISDRRFTMEERVEELINIYKQQIYSLCYKLAKTKDKGKG